MESERMREQIQEIISTFFKGETESQLTKHLVDFQIKGMEDLENLKKILQKEKITNYEFRVSKLASKLHSFIFDQFEAAARGKQLASVFMIEELNSQKLILKPSGELECLI